MQTFLYQLHRGYGELMQAVPLSVLIWFALRGKTPLQRVAPVLLDISVTLGLLLYLLAGIPVSIWHPALMFAAIALGHAVARSSSRPLVLGAWAGVLALVVTGILIARGTLAV